MIMCLSLYKIYVYVDEEDVVDCVSKWDDDVDDCYKTTK